MFTENIHGILYTVSIALSLFVIDYLLGHGFLEMLQVVFCKIVCTVKKIVREQAKQHDQMAGADSPISYSVLITEVLVLSFTVMLFQLLNKYKQYHAKGKDRIDDLLQESKDALKQTNDFLEKWKNRRVPTDYSYLDDEPQEIKPLKLEVPILHMAIIDTVGSTRSQPERGDGDITNYTDSTLLSVTSLLDDDLDSMTEIHSEEKIDDHVHRRADFNHRCLWDVMEEDATSLEDL